MPTSLTSNYLLPAVLFNPVVILHGFNTICSHMTPTAHVVSTSNYQWLENLGPSVASGPYFDVHSNEQLCWGYTILMVLVQVLAYGTVNDNRDQRKIAKAAAKAERERKIAMEKERMLPKLPEAESMNGHGAIHEPLHNVSNKVTNGTLPNHFGCISPTDGIEAQDSDGNTTEFSSEEETIV